MSKRRFLFVLLPTLLANCVADVGFDPDASSVEPETKVNNFGTGHGLNVDPANHASRPCSDLDAAHLHVTGFLRMPVKFSADDWSWSNGGFDSYLTCIRSTMPGLQVIGTIGNDTIDPSLGLPGNPYYTPVEQGGCDPHDLDLAACPQFADWVTGYAAALDPTILQQFDIIEVFNEPDDKWEGAGFRAGATISSMPPLAYAQLLDAVYVQFRSSLGVPIMMGGMDSGNPHYLTAMGAYLSDYVNIHPYGSYPAHTPHFVFDAATRRCTSSFGTLAPCFGSTENVIDNYTHEFAADGNVGPLIITEWGTNNVAEQPAYIHAWFSDAELRHSNALLFAYSDANQAGYGVKDVHDHAKPAYAAYAQP